MCNQSITTRFLATSPVGEQRIYEIGLVVNGPAILPNLTSCRIVSLAISGLSFIDFKLLQSIGSLGPSKFSLKPD